MSYPNWIKKDEVKRLRDLCNDILESIESGQDFTVEYSSSSKEYWFEKEPVSNPSFYLKQEYRVKKAPRRFCMILHEDGSISAFSVKPPDDCIVNPKEIIQVEEVIK